MVDHWLEFYHRPENEKEFPLRNGQVKNCLILSLVPKRACPLSIASLDDSIDIETHCVPGLMNTRLITCCDVHEVYRWILTLFLIMHSSLFVQVRQRASEVRQALDLLHQLNNGADIQNMLEGDRVFDYGKFKGRLDVATAAVMGHSFGGATTIQVLSEDPCFL